MRAEAKILILIGLLFLAGTAGANIPDKVTINSDKLYLFPSITGEQSTITVIVENTTPGYSGYIGGADVTLSVNDPALGTLNPVTKTTDSNGKATSIFTANMKSGYAVINISVSGYNKLSNVTLKIDHGKAHDATFTHPYEGAVGSGVPFNISFTDYWGNPVDQIINPGEQHTIQLHVHGPAPDDGGFVGYGHDISLTSDTNGNVSVGVRLSTGAGPNSVTMDQFGDFILIDPKIISGISTEPCYLEQAFNPDPPRVPADGTSTFSIFYTLLDKFRNPMSLQEIWVNTSVPGEERKYTSNYLGQIQEIQYRRNVMGNITFTATAVANTSVTISKEVEFVSDAATSMVLTANPETMASRDAPPHTSMSAITATVTDSMGNPVAGETVAFSLGPAVYGETYNVTSLPSLSDVSVITDAYGRATVQFIPGSFSLNPSDLNYSPKATGTSTITATWNTTSKDILVSWKNYPYLSMTTLVNPQTIEINQTVDVTISVTGDGFALQPNPIDVILVMDRSGSMSTDMSPGSRLSNAKTAAKTFVAQMNQSRDRIGVVSYAGYTSGTGTRTDISLSSSYTNVNTKINSLNANGATETREALKQAIELMKANPNSNPKAIQTIILMTDGDYNWKGTPLGRGEGKSSSYTGYSTNILEPYEYLYYDGLSPGCARGSDCEFTNQNMSIYAQNNDIRLYMIGFASTLDPLGVSDMQVMANATGGFYQYAPDAAKLTEIYTKIAGDLKTIAGVNATMAVDFGNVNVTDVSVPGAEVYDYIYNSTLPFASTMIKWQDGVTNVTNQSDDWADQKLDFTIGTIKVGESWSATFRLKVKKQGIIDIFGTGSNITFNAGVETLTLPHTFLTVTFPSEAPGSEGQTINMNVLCPLLAQNTVVVPITWNTTYTGGMTDITDEVSYIDESGAQVPFYKASYPVPNGTTSTSRKAPFDLRTVKPGSYQIQVRTYTPSNTFATRTLCGFYTYSTKGMTFIKLD